MFLGKWIEMSASRFKIGRFAFGILMDMDSGRLLRSSFTLTPPPDGVSRAVPALCPSAVLKSTSRPLPLAMAADGDSASRAGNVIALMHILSVLVILFLASLPGFVPTNASITEALAGRRRTVFRTADGTWKKVVTGLL
jgi:hypothetical protein